ncbi:Gas vesicle synthesis protein GvpL/GvpF [Streptomyces sp. YIM 121038]|uniref:GvpL/GvpF family gas vesicle protein n=1 Tax=Streptomyces sp. YIM 121038 TaxID=2136401 RepID=UPI0011106D4D|nr:GvpL/GvpF family gas vesicle protein [Streptomyces sp. YIM 121038]QCX80048.1 Gas vesicle synthesis protein GvpL/GvpF [Streptomyces sp. YIM 121038]
MTAEVNPNASDDVIDGVSDEPHDEPHDELRYVYAVCRRLSGPLHADLTGVGGAPPRQLAHAGLIAVVGPVPARDFGLEPLRAHLEDLDWLSETARAHQHVIGALTAVTCPLPLRLATVFRDDSGVRAMLEGESARLGRILDRIEGHVEWGVKVWLHPDAGGVASAGSSRPRGAPASGRDYLRRRREQRTASEETTARAEVFARRLHAELARSAAASRQHPPQSPALAAPGSGLNVLNAAYLVPRSYAEEFLELIARTEGSQPGLRVEVTGPWAAYSFTDDADDADDTGMTETTGTVGTTGVTGVTGVTGTTRKDTETG